MKDAVAQARGFAANRSDTGVCSGCCSYDIVDGLLAEIEKLQAQRGLDVVEWGEKLVQETAEECATIAESTPSGEYAGYQIASDIRRRFGL